MARWTTCLTVAALAAGCANPRSAPSVRNPNPQPLNQPDTVAVRSGARTKVNPRTMTCEEFVALNADARPHIVAWVDGYVTAGTTGVEDVGAVAVQRDVGVLVLACREEPKASLWNEITADLTGTGKATVKPTKITCEQWTALDDSVQPDVVYWLDGYSRGRRKEEGVLEIDTERDILVIVDVCKPAPKESLWDRVRKNL